MGRLSSSSHTHTDSRLEVIYAGLQEVCRLGLGRSWPGSTGETAQRQKPYGTKWKKLTAEDKLGHFRSAKRGWSKNNILVISLLFSVGEMSAQNTLYRLLPLLLLKNFSPEDHL